MNVRMLIIFSYLRAKMSAHLQERKKKTIQKVTKVCAFSCTQLKIIRHKTKTNILSDKLFHTNVPQHYRDASSPRHVNSKSQRHDEANNSGDDCKSYMLDKQTMMRDKCPYKLS